MKNTFIPIFLTVFLILVSAQPILAKGDIRKLTGIGDSLKAMDKVSAKEGKSYQKAKAFIESADIRQGLSKDALIKACGKPVVKVADSLRWVYKPPSSTFFEGEKIYFIFNKDGNLLSWKQVYQD